MKTYILEPIASIEKAALILCQILPGQESPWLLLSSPGDPIAYFNIQPGGDHDYGHVEPGVWADMSGRHYLEDERVLEVLRNLQSQLGGSIACDA